MTFDTIESFRNKRAEAVDFIRSKTDYQPEVLIILGTGLGNLARELDAEVTISYEDIPHFPVSTVESHSGKLLFGSLGGKRVVLMQGRFHYYEGYSMQEIAFPVRVAQALGARALLVSNAAGGMNPLFRRGDIMCITDHINMLGDNPLIGPNDNELGDRFPDMSEPYSNRLVKIAEEVALESRIKMHQGVYVAVPGPNLETRAEYRFLRLFGADVVGMSTVPEVIAAVHMKMEVFGISAITDECFPESLQPVVLDEIIEAASIAEPKLTNVIKGVLEKL
ncbi:MAG: purine-nucleoside phosphorylase [Candidatus Cyclonatronum sp.]|uniref:purine-nucleoside phosphorylase n=1 Tax=Cyclonatronum sp. TaxID=3024185 RepID=UPI0025C3D87D|nr:purine-nucleoside phosphorylase [Cyclonatronum sp.]MCH8485289.1 purine-nucleoside phosphorylase [Cyclonatronum sp.]